VRIPFHTSFSIKFNNTQCTLTGYGCPFQYSYLYTSFTSVSGVITATTTVESYDAMRFASWELEPESMYRDCSLTQLTNCLTNAGVFLFVPPGDVTDIMFDSIVPLAEQTFPFAYVNDFFDAVSTASSSFAVASPPSLTIDMGSSPLSGDFTLLSSSSLSTYAGSDTLANIKAMVSITLVLSFFTYLFFRVQNVIKHISTGS